PPVRHMLPISPCCLPQTRRSRPCSGRLGVLANRLIWLALWALPQAVSGAARILSLSSGTRRRHADGSPLCRRADRGVLDFAADEGLELGEVGREAPGQPAGGLVIGLLVGPGAARVEHFVRYLGAGLGYEHPEIGVLAHRGRGETAVEGRPQQRSR